MKGVGQVAIGLDEAYERLVANPGVVLLLGGVDTGKTSFGIELLRRAAHSAIPAALVDADIGQSTVGPPTTVGLKFIGTADDLTRESLRQADSLGFVGTLSPKGHLLPLVAATAKLVARARAAECKLIVVDTTSFVSGIYGQILKFHKMDLVRPDVVAAFGRGGELEPVVGIAHRFVPAEVLDMEVPSTVGARSVEERMAYREQRFAEYFGEGTARWRVKPTVFLPTLPPEFDLRLLDGLVVGMEDGDGTCVGIGVLEYDGTEDILRMICTVTEGVRGLRLGSIRIDTSGQSKGQVDLRRLFGTE